MKRKKRWLTAALSGAVALSSGMPVYGAAGSVPGLTADSAANVEAAGWAKNSLERWAENGVLTGDANGVLMPNKAITRAEYVAILNRVFGLTAKAASNFTDVGANDWYANELAIAKQAGYYTGFPDGTARALAPVTREDAVTLLARLFGLKQNANANITFADGAAIHAYAKDAVSALSDMIKGYSDGTFRPGSPITRAEAIVFVDRLVAGYYHGAGTVTAGTIDGNVVVSEANIVLKNTTINGNLYLTPGIGSGNVMLDHVTVKGKTFIQGGGEHTVTLIDAVLGEVSVNRPDGKVRVLAEGKTQIGRVALDSAAKLELNGESKADSVDVNAPAELSVGDKSEIGDLTIGSGANGTKIESKGTIGSADIGATGVQLGGKPLEQGKFVIDGKTAKPAGSTGGGTTGGSGSGGSGGGSGNPGNGGGGTVDPGGETPATGTDFVDYEATAETKSLFAYLNERRGQEVLFGQQHVTDEGLSFVDGAAGPQSDVKNAVGDFPAVFGWDTLSLDGKEKPGVAGNEAKSRENLADSMKEAHELGGILTLSAHMPNFVTGGMFNDTAGSVVANILPGGAKHAAYNAYLDNIAAFAHLLKDDNGKSIPLLFRPFHEQNGGWFWWGAKTTSTSEYVEIFRYTVEYLRDKKDVHNFLYVYSPNGSFGGSEASYLTTYPGDDYVDVLGMDQYDNQASPGSESFVSGLVGDLAMISKLADKKGKIATFSEFGYSPQGMKVSGNGDKAWFTRLLNAIKADPDAKRIAYMQTWANFGTNGNLFVPYKNAKDLGDHELLPDFQSYYADTYSAFAGDIKGDAIYSRTVEARAERPFMHIASPSHDGTVATNTATIRARVLNATPTKVVYTIGAGGTEVPMTLDGDGFYAADWSPSGALNGKTAEITVKAYNGTTVALESKSTVFVKVPQIQLHANAFNEATDIAAIQNNGTYSNVGTHDGIGLALTHKAEEGNGMLAMNVTGLDATDTWQELKLEIPAAAQTVGLANAKRVAMDIYVPVTEQQSGDATLRGVVMLPPDWDTKYGMSTTQQKLADLEKVTIGGQSYWHYQPVIDVNDAAKSAAATSLAISLIGSGLSGNAAILVDNIRLYSTYVEAPRDPALVDDFESYSGSDAQLAGSFKHAGGDATSVSLTASNKVEGSYAMKYDYTLAGNKYAGITKSLGGVDWSAFNKLKFYLKPDGSNQKLVIQINISGISFEAYPSLASTEAGWVTLPFSAFKPAPWDTANAGKVITKTNLKEVRDFSIYVNAVDGVPMTSGSLYFDDIRVINDGTGGVPNGGIGAGSMPAPAGTLYGFESGTQGWAVSQNNASATAVVSSVDAAAEGTHALASTFNLSGNFELTKVEAVDLSGVSAISAKVKLSSGSAKARLYIKVGSDWKWYDSGASQDLGADGFTTLTLSLANIAGREAVNAIGIKIEPAGGTGPATLYVDEVALAE
ncbi:glycosyl hydrolase [Paenibacillus methanolicus]|uniref:Mannan endo-1,4-beta-mannosidase n=1 Tax=Paenibacillus methanolicus TaxID=582686 RepID=A0A5S5C8Z9_9BACL|nr:glycosyl hydrolase [Paenibacillus methanolicus]TYP74856.1 mannan endo-1,4-beta-mannosidase [Paenibacillus methanolicus]